MMEEERVQIRDARKRCFFIVDNVIVDHYASIIGPFPTLVYMAMCRHADYSTRETHPSHEFLAKELSISRATVKRSISILIQHRLIDRKHRKSKSGDPDTNIYIILEPLGGVSQTLPTKSEMIDLTQTLHEVGSVGTEVGSVGTEGRVSQTPGVGSVGATNNTNKQEDSSNKTNTTTLLSTDVDHDPEKLTPKELVKGWNELCAGQYSLPRKKVVSADLTKKIKARLKEIPDQAVWQRIFENCTISPFLRGSETSWHVNFGWLVANAENPIKVYEGNYSGLEKRQIRE
jgi:hypothetical protein